MSENKFFNKNKPESQTPKPSSSEQQAKRMSLKQKIGLTLGTVAMGLGAQTMPSMGMENSPANIDAQPVAENIQTHTESFEIAQATPHAYHFKNDAERDAMFKKVAREAGIKADKIFDDEVSKAKSPEARGYYQEYLKLKNKGETNYGRIINWYKTVSSFDQINTDTLQYMIEGQHSENSPYDLALKLLNSKDPGLRSVGKARLLIANTYIELLKINHFSNLNNK